MLAAVDIAGADLHDDVTSSKRLVAATVRNVADHLGNTPAVCRASYIDPRVFERFREGRTVAAALEAIPTHDGQAALELVEAAVLDLLGADARSEASASSDAVAA